MVNVDLCGTLHFLHNASGPRFRPVSRLRLNDPVVAEKVALWYCTHPSRVWSKVARGGCDQRAFLAGRLSPKWWAIHSRQPRSGERCTWLLN
ncbi:hypothetical protein IG631_21138 [Alternaria alternata]|nr:hypothetical protein IG631_21138 [Alternaria alternata]